MSERVCSLVNSIKVHLQAYCFRQHLFHHMIFSLTANYVTRDICNKDSYQWHFSEHFMSASFIVIGPWWQPCYHSIRSTFAELMVCCPTAPSHRLNPFLTCPRWGSVAFTWWQISAYINNHYNVFEINIFEIRHTTSMGSASGYI